MRHYEVMILVRSSKKNEEVIRMMEQYEKLLIDSGGKTYRKENWGCIKTAYNVGGTGRCYYILMNIECDLTTLNELKRLFRLDDFIVRNLIINLKEGVLSPSKYFKNKEASQRTGVLVSKNNNDINIINAKDSNDFGVKDSEKKRESRAVEFEKTKEIKTERLSFIKSDNGIVGTEEESDPQE